jgi:hypothetical protein
VLRKSAIGLAKLALLASRKASNSTPLAFFGS